MITQLVLSGAGPYGLVQMGMVASANIDMDNIKSIHASSAGSIIGCLLCLNVPVVDILDYFINRPWDKWFAPDMSKLIESNGILSTDCFIDMLVPFFNAYDVSHTITIKEFYDHTQIDFCIYTTQVSDLSLVSMNYKSHPNVNLLQAISASACIPLLFTPININGEQYIDGGLLKHCPVPDDMDPESSMVLSIDHKLPSTLDTPTNFIYHLLIKSFNRISSNTVPPTGKYVYRYMSEGASLSPIILHRVLTDRDFRTELVSIGQSFVSGQMIPE